MQEIDFCVGWQFYGEPTNPFNTIFVNELLVAYGLANSVTRRSYFSFKPITMLRAIE